MRWDEKSPSSNILIRNLSHGELSNYQWIFQFINPTTFIIFMNFMTLLSFCYFVLFFLHAHLVISSLVGFYTIDPKSITIPFYTSILTPCLMPLHLFCPWHHSTLVQSQCLFAIGLHFCSLFDSGSVLNLV